MGRDATYMSDIYIYIYIHTYVTLYIILYLWYDCVKFSSIFNTFWLGVQIWSCFLFRPSTKRKSLQAIHPRYALVDGDTETMWQRPDGTVKGLGLGLVPWDKKNSIRPWRIKAPKPYLDGGNSNILLMFTPNLGEMIQFDYIILFFQMGWNNQPDTVRLRSGEEYNKRTWLQGPVLLSLRHSDMS